MTTKRYYLMGLDSERASAAMMALFIIAFFMMLFIWILMGGVFERLDTAYNGSAEIGTDFPVSDERITTYNFIKTGMYVMPLLGIFIPLVFYSVMMSIRKGSGGFE